MDENQKTVQEIVFEHLDRLEKSAINASKHFDGRGVHKDVVRDLVARSVLSEGKIPGDFVRAFNDLMMILNQTVEKRADKNGKIGVTMWRKYIRIIKENYEEGIKK
jgi:hypothetical protein